MSLLQMSFSGAIIILVIILVRALAINKLPKRIFILLWEVALIRLLIPFSIPSMISAYSLVNKNTSIQEILTEIPTDKIIPQVTTEQINFNISTTEYLMISSSIWFIIWIVGVVLCTIFFIISYLRCYFEFCTSLPVQNEFATKWLEEHSLKDSSKMSTWNLLFFLSYKRKVQIRQSDRISTPLTYGILRPVILVPKNTNWENTEQLQYVFLHEYIHILHFDMVLKLLATLALCIHWFNPFVWGMYLLFNRDMELACDESMIQKFGIDVRATYARTLLTMEEKKSGFSFLYNNFSKNAIEERITAIMKTKKITIWSMILGIVVLVAVVVLFATSDERKMTLSAVSVEVDKNIEAPEVVLETAKEFVKQKQLSMSEKVYKSSKIESLEYVYTYDNLEGMTLQIYQMNYKFLTDNPKEVMLAGGMSMDAEGWLTPEYANSTYLVFLQSGETLTYQTTLMENDCFPGDEVFTEDLKQQLNHYDYAGYIMEFSKDSIKVDIVEYVIDDDTERKKELIEELGLIEGDDLADGNFLDGYYIYNPDNELVEWELSDKTIYTFIDWYGDYTDSSSPKYYSTTNRAIFEDYIKTYHNSEPRMPFFFVIVDGIVKMIVEEPIV